MPRYIDADALLKDARRLIDTYEEDGHEQYVHINAVEVAAINVAPTVDAVEVVRCKDCIFFQPYEGEEHEGECEELVGLESCVYEDDFCSYGERA